MTVAAGMDGYSQRCPGSRMGAGVSSAAKAGEHATILPDLAQYPQQLWGAVDEQQR
jgi:hypothetical protein